MAGSCAGVTVLGDTWATRASATAPGAAGSQPLQAPAGSVPRRGGTSWVTHRAATRAARTPERSAAESCRGRLGSRRPPGCWAAGCSGDRAGHGSAEATPLRRGSGQARASRARRPPRPPPAAAATPPQLPPALPQPGAQHRLPTRRAVSRATATPARRLAATRRTRQTHGWRGRATCFPPHELCKDRLDLKPKAASLRSNSSFSASVFKHSLL